MMLNIILFALSLPHNNLCYIPLLPFQKWTRLGAQHSMAFTEITESSRRISVMDLTYFTARSNLVT